MELQDPRCATQAMRSVVVCLTGLLGNIISFVVVANTAGTSPSATSSATLVVAPSSFVAGRKHMGVCFFDGTQSRAQFVSASEEGKGDFCLITTKLHTLCEEVKWMESTSPRLTPSPTFILTPGSKTSAYYQPTFTNVESTESYLVENYATLATHSKNYFLVTCEGHGDLTGMSVFTIGNGSPESIAMGVVFKECREGSEIRVAVTAARFKEILQELVGEAPPSPPRRKTPPTKRKPRKTKLSKRKRRKTLQKAG